jgi:hypothetical protein
MNRCRLAPGTWSNSHFSTIGRWRSKHFRFWAAALASTMTFVVAAPRIARAEESIIKRPGDHPHYFFEAEPHALLGFAGPFKEKGHFGAGFRGTIVLVDNGFIRTINNSVGITFGADLFVGKETLFIPVAMQWNFWLSTHWSVFGEPGVGLALKKFEAKEDVVHPILMAGGRYHFSEKISLTMRIGYPAFSIGASFFF